MFASPERGMIGGCRPRLTRMLMSAAVEGQGPEAVDVRMGENLRPLALAACVSKRRPREGPCRIEEPAMAIPDHIASLHPEITAWRRDLHAHPELLFDVHRTAAIVADKLKTFGRDGE